MSTDTAGGQEGAQPSKERTRFDHVNAVIYHDSDPDRILLQLGVPLSDGSVADAKILLDAPLKVVGPDGKPEYKMNVNSSLSVTEVAKDPAGDAKVELRDGLLWSMPNDYAGAWTALLDHEPHVKKFLTERFQTGAVFVDVGANVGAYSLRAALSGMEVYAFEPNPRNIKLLTRNAELNHLTLELADCALGAEEGTAHLTPNGAVSRITESGELEVPVHTLDSYELPAVDLVKVDVEGYELEVLRGAQKTLERSHPAMMVEMHHWAGAEKEAALFQTLKGLGYRFEYLDRYAQGRHLGATWEG